ncbi:hypothetical protein CTA1_3833 [Colletotrichum tanaceti]|uniref:Uncharacterized protein n=1 Tax=Colletotrichum tanaceti TaxID=1306861 RepID=A0A4U6X6D8_9PEZI|nr:hypothetical protein CTA1_3833 [Colletotrichum tanaceti]
MAFFVSSPRVSVMATVEENGGMEMDSMETTQPGGEGEKEGDRTGGGRSSRTLRRNGGPAVIWRGI